MLRDGPRDLLVELGTEEIPAGFLAAALPELAALAAEKLASARLAADSVRSLGTPRRLAFIATAVPDRQPDLSERVIGPPARIAFDETGGPTRAAEGFANKNGVDVSALVRSEVEGKKGEYAVCTREQPGRAASEVLPGLIAEVLGGINWPKSMRWGFGESLFVRPVHWLVALLGPSVVPLQFAGVASGRTTRGHRFLATEPIEIASPAEYAGALRAAHVVVDPDQRRTMIAAELARIEREVGYRIRPDAELESEVVDLVEYPVAVCGEFDPSFLAVPEAVVVSAMRAHQRYFAMEDDDGRLVSRFVTIAGTITRDVSVVRAGNERVLAARLADANFFFTEDQKLPLETLRGRLDGVVFQSRLGSIGDKVRRVEQLAVALAADVGADRAATARASQLCKADLVTSMVHEFPDLQGVMGRRYARLAGEPDAVATAIEEHYLPRGKGDTPPATDVGACVGVADRVDTIVGCFAAGLAPTGSADPYGLRRAAVGVLSILMNRSWTVSLEALVDRAVGLLPETLTLGRSGRSEVLAFFTARLKRMLGGLPTDCVEAALAAGSDNVPDARARAEAVARLRTRADFEPLATAFKRVANILKGEAVAAEPNPDRFVEDNERELWGSFRDIEERVDDHLAGGDYNGALQVLSELKAPVDKFFDSVLVMDEDEQVKNNRLALLGRINATFTRIADFRQLAV